MQEFLSESDEVGKEVTVLKLCHDLPCTEAINAW